MVVVLHHEAAVGGFAEDFADVAAADGAPGRQAVAVGVVVRVAQRGVVDGVCCGLRGVKDAFRQEWRGQLGRSGEVVGFCLPVVAARVVGCPHPVPPPRGRGLIGGCGGGWFAI